jgi:hypothetical protein
MRIITIDIDASFHNADRLLARLASQGRAYQEPGCEGGQIRFVATVTEDEWKRLRVLCVNKPSRLQGEDGLESRQA